MRTFKTTIKTLKENNEIISALKSLILKQTDSVFIFPFSFLKKEYYRHLRVNRNRYYSGDVNQTKFKFTKNILYGSLSSGSRTSSVLNIQGQIANNNDFRSVTVDFLSPTFEIIIRLLIIAGCLLTYTMKGNTLFIVIPVILILGYSWQIMRNYLIIKKRIRNKNRL